MLIVDNNANKRAASRASLSSLAYEIVEADSGLAALRCVLAQPFAVILLDVRMPIMDGYETAAIIREREQSELTPIIFITAEESEDVDDEHRYADGAVDFLFAPVSPGVLRAKVSVFANQYRRAESLAARARELQDYADHLGLLTDAAPVGIFQTDAANRYVYTNAEWSEITGISADEAYGTRWDEYFGPELRHQVLGGIPDADPTRPDRHHRFSIRVPGGDSRIGLVNTRVIPGRHGETTGWVGTLADVTAAAGAEAAMSAARDAAIAGNAMQEMFATSASHELRTPTTVVLGFAEELLESPTLSEQDHHFADLVYRNAKRLSQLVDDLLVVGEAGVGPTMHLEPTALGPLVERVVSTFSESECDGAHRIATDCDPDLPLIVVDPLRIEQVLTNLVSNAVKFTPAGGEVGVVVRRVEETIEVAVSDTGPGIAPAELDKIFDRFYRTNAALDASVRGSGLGLAIAKGMVEAQRGTIRVASTLGEGSTFTIALPLAEPSSRSEHLGERLAEQ